MSHDIRWHCLYIFVALFCKLKQKQESHLSKALKFIFIVTIFAEIELGHVVLCRYLSLLRKFGNFEELLCFAYGKFLLSFLLWDIEESHLDGIFWWRWLSLGLMRCSTSS
jgi:hypothetical protein